MLISLQFIRLSSPMYATWVPVHPLSSSGYPHRNFRSVGKLSSAPKISRNTRKFIQKSIMHSISIPRPLPYPTLFTPGIAANRQMTPPGYLLGRSFSWALSQTVMASSHVLFHFPHETSADHFGALPTPSPEVMHQQVSEVHVPLDADVNLPLKTLLPTWETLRPDGSSAPSTGAKRSHDYTLTMEDFLQDVKKRRVIPSYDSRMRFNLRLSTTCDSYAADMADRLTSLAYADVTRSDSDSIFNPRSVSLDIRTPEELAAVNQFLLTLGRDVTTLHESRPSSSSQAFSHYFDYDELNQLGLTGMPGIATSNTTSHVHGSYSSSGGQYSSQTSLYGSNTSVRAGQPLISGLSYGGSMYPSIHDMANQGLPSTAGIERRMSTGSGIRISPFPVEGYQHPSPLGHVHVTPPLDSSSPRSSLSSPSNSTPPHVPHTDSAVIFERTTSRRIVPPAVLAPVDYTNTTKSLRSVVQHRSIPVRSPSPVDSELSSSPTSPMRTLPPTLAPPTSLLGRPLYPLFTSGDDDLRLPPLQKHHPRLSPPSSPSHDKSTNPVLPSLREVAASAGTSTPASGVEERLSRRFDGLRLSGRSNDDRSRHAALIRDLLVTINERYRAQFTPAPPPVFPSHILLDTEMSALRS